MAQICPPRARPPSAPSPKPAPEPPAGERRPRLEFAHLHAHNIVRHRSERDAAARQSRDTPWRFRAVSGGGRSGLDARLSLARSAWWAGIRVVSGGGGIRTLEGPNGP